MTETARLHTTGLRALSRADLCLAVVLAGLANGFASRALTSISEMGWEAALYATFDISALVWIACFILAQRLRQVPPRPVRGADLVMGLACAAIFVMPLGQASWLALTLFGLYMVATAREAPGLRTAGLLLLAICLPMFWARMLLSLFAGPLLHADAALVAGLLGRTAVENTIPLTDGSGVLWIAPACSSVINIALTLLCAALFVSGNNLAWSGRLVAWTAGACLAVGAVNIARLCALALFPAQYDTLHGAEGGAAFAFLILLVMVGVMALAVKHERAALA